MAYPYRFPFRHSRESGNLGIHSTVFAVLGPRFRGDDEDWGGASLGPLPTHCGRVRRDSRPMKACLCAAVCALPVLCGCSDQQDNYYSHASRAWELTCPTRLGTTAKMRSIDERVGIPDFRYAINGEKEHLATAQFITSEAVVVLTVTGPNTWVTVHNDRRMLREYDEVSTDTLGPTSKLLDALRSIGCKIEADGVRR